MFRRYAWTSVDGDWFCSRVCVERMARRRLSAAKPFAEGLQNKPPMRLGALLRHQGACSSDQLAAALKAQLDSRLKLGAQLRAMGVVDQRQLLRALGAQAGIGYLATVNVAVVADAPGGLSPDAIATLGVMPLEAADGDRIKVACKAPVPRLALQAFARFTGWTPEPYLVSDEDWTALARAYGSAVPAAERATRLSGFTVAQDVSEAAARIAAAATSARAATVQEARWEPYTWVRVQGSGIVSDVVLAQSTESRRSEEGRWRAASTSH
jgi:hypothetical protein